MTSRLSDKKRPCVEDDDEGDTRKRVSPSASSASSAPSVLAVFAPPKLPKMPKASKVTACRDDDRASPSDRWRLYRPDRTSADVAAPAGSDVVAVLAQHPDAVAAILVATAEAACASCRHRSRFDNCGEPERAGLCPPATYWLTKHPEGGRGCAVFQPSGAAE